jgi:hypothetical protein
MLDTIEGRLSGVIGVKKIRVSVVFIPPLLTC